MHCRSYNKFPWIPRNTCNSSTLECTKGREATDTWETQFDVARLHISHACGKPRNKPIFDPPGKYPAEGEGCSNNRGAGGKRESRRFGCLRSKCLPRGIGPQIEPLSDSIVRLLWCHISVSAHLPCLYLFITVLQVSHCSVHVSHWQCHLVYREIWIQWE